MFTTVDKWNEKKELVEDLDSDVDNDKPDQYTEEGQLYWFGWNPHFKWKNYEEDQLSDLSPRILERARQNPSMVITIPEGHQEYTRGLETWDGSNVNTLPWIKKLFRVNLARDLEGCCMWLSACLGVSVFNKDKAADMFYEMKDSISTYEWIYMYKANKQGGSTLAELLKEWTPIQLRKVSQVDKSRRLEHLLHKNTTGIYVCVIQDQSRATHAVSVNCNHDPKLILDCYEDRALELSKEKLTRCCGPNSIFKSIEQLGEIWCPGSM